MSLPEGPRRCKGCGHDITEYAPGLVYCAACDGPRGRSGSPATHTPGKGPTLGAPAPWRVKEQFVLDARGGVVCDLSPSGPDGGEPERGRLIAAAPETAAERDRLREALTALVLALEIHTDCGALDCIGRDRHLAARAALGLP